MGSLCCRISLSLVAASAFSLLTFSDASAQALVLTTRGVGGDWTDANWSAGVPTVGHNAQITGGTITQSGTHSVGALTLSGGTFNPAGTVTVSGTLTLSGTTLSGAGSISANGGASVTNSFSIYSGQTLNLAGSSTWSAGTIYHGTGAILNNSGTLTNTGNTSLYYYYSGGSPLTFNNSGTFIKSTGTGTTDLNATISNAAGGKFHVQSGTLNLGGGGSSSGVFEVDAGTTLQLSGGSFAFNTGSTINGNGTVQITGGTTTFSGSNTGTANLGISGGTATFSGTTSTSGGGTFSGGTLNGAGTVSFAQPLTLSGTTLNGTGSVSANGGANITNSFSLHAGQTLNLAGTSTWSAGTIYHGTNAVLSNTGTLTNTGNTSLYYYYSGGSPLTFNNSGTFIKSTATGTTDLNATVTNTGTGKIHVQSGTLNLGGGGSSSGVFEVDAGTTLQLSGGSFAFNTGSTINGSGTVQITGGTTTFSGSNTGTANLGISGGTATFSGTTSTSGGGTFSGGTLNGAGTVSFAQPLTLSGTTLSGTGSISANGGANITNSFNLHSGQTLNLAGSSTWSAGTIYHGTNAVLSNTGTLTNTGNTSLYYYYSGGSPLTFNNSGTFIKSTGTGTTDLNATISNAAGGKFHVQSGTLNLGGGGSSSGVFEVDAGTTLRLSGGSFAFNSGSTINGTGTIQISGGTTTFSGANTGTAKIGISGGTATFSGTTSTSGGGTFSGGTLNGSGTVSFGQALTLSGTTLGGTGTISANGGANITNSFSLHAGQTLNLAGSSTWSAGTIYHGTNAILNNTGTVTNTGNTSFSYYYSGGSPLTFNNSGTFTKSTATGNTDINAVFNNSGAVDVQTGTLTLRGGGSATATSTFTVANGAALAFDGGTHALASGASFSGAGTVSVNSGVVSIAAGTANFGRLTVAGGQLQGAAGSAAVGVFTQTSGSTSIGTLTIAGASSWTGGDWHGATGSTAAIGATATLAMGGGGYHDFNRRAITNSGIVNWSSGYIRSSNGGSFTNASGATFNDLVTSGYTIHNPSFEGTAGTFTFTNNGAYVRNAANTSYIDVPFINNGTVSVQQGDLQFRSGGTLAASGSISVAAGTNVYFTNGFTVASGTSLTGAGGFRLTGGTLDVAGSVTVGTLTQTGGTLAGTNIFDGVINWHGGDWHATEAGPSTTVAVGATLNLANGGYRDFNRRAIVNRGTVNWHSGYIRSSNGGSFTNAAGATFYDLQTSGYTIHNPSFGGTAGTFTFTNNGTYVRNAANTSYIDVPFDNNGTVSVVQGNLQFRSGGTLAAAGSVAAAAGTNVYFTEGYVVNNGSSLAGAGTYWLTGGLFTLTGQINVGTFKQTGGTLGGTGTIAGLYDWTGGNWNTAATGPSTTVASGATLNIGSGGYHDFNRRAIVNQGTVNWTSGYLRSGNGGSFTNAGTFNDQNASGYSVHNPSFDGTAGSFVFSNTGTYVRNTTGTTYFDTTFDNSGTLNLQQGVLQLRGGGTMAASSVVNASDGTTLYFTDNYTIAHGASLNGLGAFTQTGGTLTLNGTLKASNFQWHGGNWNAAAAGATTTIGATTVLNLGNGGYHDFNYREIVNQGTVNWGSGYLRSGNGGSFTNAAGGTFNDANASGYSVQNPGFGGTFVFNNLGTYVRNTTGTTYFETTFDNNGTINLQQGTLQIRGGGTMGAASVVNASSGTNLLFTDGYTLLHGAQFLGAGNFAHTGGTLVLNGSLKASKFTWSGGNWNGAGTTTIDSSTVLDVAGSYMDFAQRAIVNEGVVNWKTGYLRGGNGSTFTNAAGATFNDLNSSSYTAYNPSFGGTAGTFVFTNHGTYVRNTTGTTYFDTTFNNQGTLNLQGGDLWLRGGGTMGATSIVDGSAGTKLYFSENYTLADGARFTGAGQFNHSGGTLTIDGALRASAFVWSGGNWNAAANSGLTTTIAAGTTLNLTSASDGYRDFVGRGIVNEGIINWSSGYIRSHSGGSLVIASGGVFNDLNSPGYTIHNPGSGSFTVTNRGLYHKQTTGTTSIQVPFTNDGGSLLVAGGTLRFTASYTHPNGSITLTNNATADFDLGLSLPAGSLSGAGTVAANVTNGGTISPGASIGRLNVSGSLTLLNTSLLLFDLGGAAQATGFDFLSISGNTALAGSIGISFRNGFEASVGPTDTFTILTAGTTPTALSGLFSNVSNGQRLFTIDGAGSFQVNYGSGSLFAANSVVLSNFVAVPEPSTWAMMGIGSLLLIVQWRRRRR